MGRLSIQVFFMLTLASGFANASDSCKRGDESCNTDDQQPLKESVVERDEEEVGAVMRTELLQGGLRTRAKVIDAIGVRRADEDRADEVGADEVEITKDSIKDETKPAANDTKLEEDEEIFASCEEQESIDVSMACLCRAIYDFPIVGKSVPGWKIVKEHREADTLVDLPGIGTDKMSIYKNNKGVCALAISGSDDVDDWITDFNFFPEPACKLEMHRGFYEEITRLTKDNTDWPAYKQYLRNSCNKVFYVGHSLGGALVSALAACNAAGTESALQGLPFDGLYTFGAPGISTTAPAMKGGGCFPGRRFYTLDLVGGDPVPAITDAVGLKHPKIEAVRLWDKVFWGVHKEINSCKDPETTSIPHFGIVPRPLLHLPGHYIGRAHDVF